MFKPIFLIGPMGSGKSSLAQYITQHNKQYTSFLDTDTVISTSEGMSIPELFIKKGEDYFRNAEHQLILTFRAQNTVIATGGGTPCFNNTIDFMLEKGWVIFLQTSPSILAERLWNNKDKRPLLTSCKSPKEIEIKLNELMESRLPFYSKAHISIQNEGSMQSAFDQINDRLNGLFY